MKLSNYAAFLYFAVSSVISTVSYGQIKDCSKRTLRMDKSKGVDMTLYYPCEFQEYEIPRPNTVFMCAAGDGELSTSISLLIVKMDYPSLDLGDVHKFVPSKTLSEAGLSAKVLSEKNISINGLPCKEWIAFVKVEMPASTEYQKKLTYTFMLNSNMITINYQVFGLNKEKVNSEFAKLTKTYKELAQKIQFTHY